MLEFKQSEIHAERRRWLFKLTAAPVDNEIPSGLINSSNQTYTLAFTPLSGSLKLSLNGQLLSAGGVDFTLSGTTTTMVGTPQTGDTLLASYEVTAVTGQTGTGFLSKNGAAGVATTASMVEVDSGDMPGLYYIQLTASELDTLGFLNLYVKTSSSIAVIDTAIVSYNDPYTSAGGFSSGTNTGSFKMTKRQLELLAELVWKYKVTEEATAQEKLLEAAEHPLMDMQPIMDKFSEIEIPDSVDLQPVLDKIDAIEIPKPKDFSKSFVVILEAIKNLNSSAVVDTKELRKIIADFSGKMSSAIEEVSSSTDNVKKLQEGFEKLDGLVQKFSENLAVETDMDRRFGAMGAKLNDGQLEKIRNDIAKLAVSLVDVKYEIIKQIK